MRLWLSKPVYEFLPWFHGAAGVLLLLSALRFEGGYGLALCLTLGVALVAVAGWLGWHRRAYRRRR